MGAAAGHAAGEKIDPTVEDAYWAKTYSTTPYVRKGTDYKTYRPAYKYGWESYERYPGKKWDDVEQDLARNWDTYRDGSSLSWDDARMATRDAWGRLENRRPYASPDKR